MKKKTRTLNCRINDDLYERLNNLKDSYEDDAITLSNVIQSALYEYVKIREGKKNLELINSHILEAINSAISMNNRGIKKEVSDINKRTQLILRVLKDNLELDDYHLQELESQLNRKSDI